MNRKVSGIFQHQLVEHLLPHLQARNLWVGSVSIKLDYVLVIWKFIPSAIGVQDWKVFNDKDLFCPDSQRLSLSSCSQSEFNCDDGSCVSMEKRCNQVSECPDESDEYNCMAFPPMPQYQVSTFDFVEKKWYTFQFL